MQNQTSGTLHKLQWLLAIPIILLVFGLAFSGMLTDALWFDEILTHGYAGSGGLEAKSIPATILDVAIRNPSWPPLYYVLQNIWAQLTGNSLLSEHILLTFFGLLTVSLSYRFGRDLFGNTGGLFAALLVGTSGIFIHFLHETRAYTMYTFLVLLIGWLYWQIANRPDYKVRWLRWGFPLAIATALYTHYVSGTFIAAILLYHLIFERPSDANDEQKKRWMDIIKLWFNGCLVFAPWIGILAGHVLGDSGHDRSSELIPFIQSTLVTFTNNTWIVALIILLMSLIWIGRRPIRFVWVWLGTSLILITIVNSVVSFLFHPRHFLALLPVGALLLAASLFEIYKRAKIVAIALVAIWVGLGIYYAFQDNFLSIIPRQYEILPITLVDNTRSLTEQCLATDDTIIFNIMPYEIEYQYETSFYLYYFRERNVDYNTEYLGTLTTENQRFSTLFPEIIELPYNERIETVTAESEQVWILSRDELYTTEEFAFTGDTLVELGHTNCGNIAVSDDLRADLFTRGDSCEVILNTCTFEE